MRVVLFLIPVVTFQSRHWAISFTAFLPFISHHNQLTIHEVIEAGHRMTVHVRFISALALFRFWTLFRFVYMR